MSKILDNIRVVDFTTGHTGTYATMLLADFGAEVIKIENPTIGGDPIRNAYPKNERGSAFHAYLNRGKKSVCLDWNTSEGQELIMKLIKTADVVVDSFPSGELEACGLGYEDAAKENEDIIYASLTGFGKYGPMSNTEGCDLTSEAMSGMMEICGFVDSGPTAHGSRIADQFGGVHLAIGIIGALIVREKTGEGQIVEVSTADCMFGALEDCVAEASLCNVTFHREGNGSRAIAPYDVFNVKDGIVATAISTNAQWDNFLEAMNLEYLHDDHRFDTNESRGEYYYTEEGNPNGLRELLEEKFKDMTKQECEELFRPLNIPSGPGMTVEEAYHNEQLNLRNMVLEVNDASVGPIKLMGVPIKISGNDDTDIHSAPLMGADTDKYLNEINEAGGK